MLIQTNNFKNRHPLSTANSTHSICVTNNKSVPQNRNDKSVLTSYPSCYYIGFKGTSGLKEVTVQQAREFLTGVRQDIISQTYKAKISDVLTGHNAALLEPLVTAKRDSQNSPRFRDFDIHKLLFLAATNPAIKKVLGPVLDARGYSNEQLNTDRVGDFFKNINEQNLGIIPYLINPKTNRIHSNYEFSYRGNISELLGSITPQNIGLCKKLLSAQEENGQPKISHENTVRILRGSNDPEEKDGLDFLVELCDYKKLKFLPREIEAISNSQMNPDDKRTLLGRLEGLPAITGEIATKIIERPKKEYTDFIFANKTDESKVKLLYALYDDAERIPYKKIVNNAKLHELTPKERKQLALYVSSIEYKKTASKIKLYGVQNELLPPFEESTNLLHQIIGTMKLPKLSGELQGTFFASLSELDGKLERTDKADIEKLGAENANSIMDNINTLTGIMPELKAVFFRDNKINTPAILTLKAIVSSPIYKQFDENTKTTTKLIAMFSNLPAEGNEEEKAAERSLQSRIILSKTNVTPKHIDIISDLLKAQSYANDAEIVPLHDALTHFRRPDDFEITDLIIKSKIESGEDIGISKEEYYGISAKVRPMAQNVVNTMVVLPQTRIPRASEMHNIPYEEIGGEQKTKNKVIRFNQIDNFEHFGFDRGTTRDNFSCVVHAIFENAYNALTDAMIAPKAEITNQDKINQIALDDFFNEGVYSTSYINASNHYLFQNSRYAFIFDVDPANIAVASNEDLWSSFTKGEENFIRQAYPPRREEFSKGVKEKMQACGMQDVDARYRDLYSRDRTKAFTDMDWETAAKIREHIDAKVMNKQGEHNEAIVRAPKIRAIIVKNWDLDQTDYRLRKFAEDNDIPIIHIDDRNPNHRWH